MTTSKFVANDPFGGRDLLSNQNDPSHCIYMIFCKSQASKHLPIMGVSWLVVI